MPIWIPGTNGPDRRLTGTPERLDDGFLQLLGHPMDGIRPGPPVVQCQAHSGVVRVQHPRPRMAFVNPDETHETWVGPAQIGKRWGNRPIELSLNRRHRVLLQQDVGEHVLSRIVQSPKTST